METCDIAQRLSKYYKGVEKMNKRNLVMSLLLIFTFALTACGGAAPTEEAAVPGADTGNVFILGAFEVKNRQPSRR